MIGRHLTTSRAIKVALSVVVLVAFFAVFRPAALSGASYTAGSANPANVLAAGLLSHTNSKADEVVLDAGGIRPGQTATGTLALTGGGTLTGMYALSRVSLVDSPSSPGLSNALTLRIQDVTSATTTLYNGSAASFTSATLGAIAPGTVKTYRFSLTFPSAAADADLQGAAMMLVLRFTGVSS